MERVSGEGGAMSKIRIQVFLVDTGAMYHVEAGLNLPVTCLKESISKMTRIPVEKQVLLLSGGVPLFPDTPLCQYESVSDNTVFLVCKSSVPDIARPVTVSQRYSEEELLAQLDASIKMPAVLETVRNRMLLVQSTCDIDKRELVEIRQLVFDQHLQQQGWAAVVAHLEEVCSGFRTRVLTFQKLFGEYINMREDIFALLRRMPDVLTLLGKIPVLACLENTTSSISVSMRGGSVDRDTPVFVSGSLTLYSWINMQARLEDVIHDVTSGTKQMGEQFEEAVNQEIEQVWQSVDGRPEMRCIGGIEERLYSLDKLTNNVKGIVDMQISTKEGFRSNWSRLEIEKDGSILPDLCASHRTQMHELRERHRKLVDLKKKCVVAKKELCNSIQSRLPWLMQIHQAISSLSSSLSLHHALLKRILRRVDILRQVEKAPQVYAMMVVEVVRRRLFSEYYIKWATGVAAESKKEHKKEAHRRRAFSKQCGPHFLKKMFIGFKDHVPKFATEPLEDIDHNLPSVTSADISHLSKSVPELQHLLRIPTDTGSPAIGPAFQQAHGDMDVDPFMIETTQSMASSTASFITRSITSVTQSVSEAGSPGAMLLLGERERDKLSLSYQAGERWREAREGGESKETLFLSLQENIPVPQCLSETLTAEVNSAAMSTISVSVMSASPQSHEFSSALEELGQAQQQQHPEGGGDGVLLSSGDLEPTKSSDSDIISHESQSEHKPRKKRRSVKGLSDTSPDAETSQEFATADFYFEDSMPSSITDSPPKPSGSGKAQGEVDAVLVEKAKRVDELEGKVCALQSKLAGSQEKLASLHSVLNSDVSYLRESLGALRDSVRDSEGQRRQDLAEAHEVVGRLCSSLVESLDRDKEELVRQEREGSRQTLEELEAKYQAKCQSMEELQQGMLKVSHCIADVNKELQQQRESSQREMESVRERHEEELRELRRQNMLEVELETDRLRTEMQRSLDEQDAHVQRLQQELQQASRDLAQALKEKEVASETLLLEFEEEKKQLQESLQAEKTHALEQVRAAVMAESKKEAESLLQKENEQKQSEVQQQLEELKSIQERELAEQAEQLQAKHEAERVSWNTEWADKLAALEASVREEFNTEVEKLKAEVQRVAQTPEVRDVGVQSEDISLRDQGVQTDVFSVSVDEQGVQSEPCEVGDHSVQWDFCWGLENSTVQTDPPSVTEQGVQCDWQPDVCDHHSQTELVSVDQETQTEELPVCEHSVQSDSASVRDQGIQGDIVVLNSQGVESDSCVVVDQGIQSDVRSVSDQAVQCEDDDILLPKPLRPSMSEAEPQASTEVSQLYEKLLEEQTERMQRKLAELREQHMRDKEAAVQNCKRSVLAERQISFNEAIAKAVRDKDAMIEDLKAQLDVVTARGTGGEGESEEGPDLRKQLAGLKEQESDLKHKNRRLESEVLMLQQQLHQYSEQFQTMTASTASVSISAASTPMTQSTTEGAMARSMYFEQEARAKDQKISDLEKQLMEMSMTTSFRKEARDKVSILTCVAGDIVLLCLDERHDQYVVFTMGTTLHFLHSDCIDQLGLRPVEGEPRKNWVLAEVTDREYCQARKAQNRFKVPVNTKFYRVKAKPWLPKSSSSSS